MGVVVLYVIGVQAARVQIIVAVCVVAMTVNLLVGSYWGAKSRIVYENWLQDSARLYAQQAELEDIRHRISILRADESCHIRAVEDGPRKEVGA